MGIAHILLQTGGVRATIPSLVAHASPFSKLILLILVVMSVWTWAIVWNRMRLYARVETADAAFLKSFRASGTEARLLAQQHPASVLARLARSGQQSLDDTAARGSGTLTRPELAQRSMERAANDAAAALERHVGFLATTGNVAPFIGLLGTVWGVMVSFVNIGAQGSATLVVVAPGIAEALIATIAGLGAAIPSVIAYNHCLGRVQGITHGAQQFASEFLDRRLGTGT